MIYTTHNKKLNISTIEKLIMCKKKKKNKDGLEKRK